MPWDCRDDFQPGFPKNSNHDYNGHRVALSGLVNRTVLWQETRRIRVGRTIIPAIHFLVNKYSPPDFHSVEINLSGETPRYSLRSGRGGPPHLVTTPNPASLVPADYIDFSPQKLLSITPCFPTFRSGILYMRKTLLWRNWGVRQSFPKCGGFFYYRDQDAAPLEGSVRFRITSDNAPSSFDHGQDLLLASGMLWQVIFPHIASRNGYARIRDQLLVENPVTAEQLTRCLAMFGAGTNIYPGLDLFRLGQEFPINFSGEINLSFVGQSLHRLTLKTTFYLKQSTGKYYYPWDGEPQTSLLKPEAGQLLSRSRAEGPDPWAYDIDASDIPLATALRALWDNSRIGWG
ncbi:hypothetical protein B0H14DRAFT_3152204, partial [Mycena olivaceomarginata]